MAPPRPFIYVLALACLVLGGAFAPVARADHGEPFQSETFKRYLEVAAAQWEGPAPTCTGADGQPIQVHATLYDDPDPDVSASAEQPGCRIWLDRDFWPTEPDEIDCTILVHEWGHLLGMGHSDDKANLMYESPTEGAPGCAVFSEAREESEPKRAPRKAGRPGAARRRRAARKRQHLRGARQDRRVVARRMRRACPRQARRTVAYFTRSGVPVRIRRPRRSTAELCSRTQPFEIRPGIRDGWFVP